MSLKSMCQDLSTISQREALKVSGGINMTSIGYKSFGLPARRDPFNWMLTGNINFSVYGWNVPFSFSYSNQNAVFRQPFNQYGISPQYKWVKAYLGYHNLTYSSYTLAGHTFLGAGVELTPGKLHFHAMYGRFNKAVAPDTAAITTIVPAFRRMGFAMKTGYAGKNQSVDFIILYAVDDTHSLLVPADTLVANFPELRPAENIALSLAGKTVITKRLNLHAEWAASSLTRDRRSVLAENQQGPKSMGGLMKVRTTTGLYQAFKSRLGYAGQGYNLQLQYERVDPGYETLGAYFFNNDLENITIGGSLQLLQNKISLNAQGGVQKNNLHHTDIRQTRRFVNNFTISWLPAEQWNLSATYSNFTTYTNVRPLDDPFFRNELDSLNFYQINQNASANTSYQFGPKESKQAIMFNGTYQVVDEKATGSRTADNNSYFYSGNISYRYAIAASNLTLTAGTSCYRNIMQAMKSLTIGPVVSVSKAFFEKKLRANLSSSFNQVSTNGEYTSRVANTRLNGSYALKKKHNFSMNLNALMKMAVTPESSGFTELTVTLNYGYSF